MFPIFGRKPNAAKDTFIIAGLGNPGKKYISTRHNVGFLAIDYVCEKLGIATMRKKFSALYSESMLEGVKAIFLKPQTFMNLSGISIRKAADYYEIPPERILVICDDVTISPGTLRIREKGSSGGHNGLKSIEEHLSSREFPRLRIGVGNEHDSDLSDHVLSQPSAKDREIIQSRFEDVYHALKLIVSGDLPLAQSLYNGPPQQIK
ncbi:MAG: aminoacyl-tRNA hydrolase [Ruminococcaceae bacterium]|nr:aminoacyl-tRNA hydrolase [Oscillospiraceae bacterium]